MYKILIVMLFVCTGYACKKEYSGNTVNADNTSVVQITTDDEDIAKQYSPNQVNEFSQYSFGGVAGTYFGYTSSFRISEKENLEITFGTLLTTNVTLTNGEIMELLKPGKKEFGSLGAFTSYPQIKPHCAEVSFTDKKSARWCSTILREHQAPGGIEAEVEIDQPGQSEFVIDKTAEVDLDNNVKGYRVQGHFNCVMYEVNGKHHKKMKGNFSGIVGNAN